MEDEAVDTRYAFEERDGRRLRFFAGQPGKYVGVTEHKGKHKTSYYARASITKRKGDARRQYAIKGSFRSAVAAAIAIADAEADPLGPPSPEGERKPRKCVLPARTTHVDLFCALTLGCACCCVLAAKSILDRLGVPQTNTQENSTGQQLLARPAVQPPCAAALALPFEGNLNPAALIPVVVQPRLLNAAAYTSPQTGNGRVLNTKLQTPWLQGCCAVAGVRDGRQDGVRADERRSTLSLSTL